MSFSLVDSRSPRTDTIITVPRMTPILRNRHEKVQEATINLIGRIGEPFEFLQSAT